MKSLYLTSLFVLATSFLSSKFCVVNGQENKTGNPVYISKEIGKIKVNEDEYLSINNIAGGKLNSDRKEELYDCKYTYIQGTTKIKFLCSFDVYNCGILHSCKKERTMNVSFTLRGSTLSEDIDIERVNLYDVNGEEKKSTDILFEQRYDKYNVGHYLINGEQYDINKNYNSTKLMEIYHHTTNSNDDDKPAIMNYNWFLMANDTYIGIGN